MAFDPRKPVEEAQGDILVVDDALDNLRVLCEVLNRRGYVTRCVRDGNSALQAAFARPPDLVLLDIRLPDMNGYDVCKRLKESPLTQQAPVIFISALDQPMDRIQGFESGGDDYITKPFYEREVLVRVESKLIAAQWRMQQRELALAAERQRIARDLHDSLQQTLFILGASAQSLSQQPQTPDDLVRELTRIHALSESAAAELRVMLFELRPDKLAQVGLSTLLNQLVESSQHHVEAELKLVAVGEPVRLKPDIHMTFYRIAQEALHNAIVHAKAKHITLSLHSNEQRVILHIVDDGVGYDTGKTGHSRNGLENMKARAVEHNLELTITSQLNVGTEVKLICNCH